MSNLYDLLKNEDLETIIEAIDIFKNELENIDCKSFKLYIKDKKNNKSWFDKHNLTYNIYKYVCDEKKNLKISNYIKVCNIYSNNDKELNNDAYLSYAEKYNVDEYVDTYIAFKQHYKFLSITTYLTIKDNEINYNNYLNLVKYDNYKLSIEDYIDYIVKNRE